MTTTVRSRRVPLTGATLAVAALLAAGCASSSSGTGSSAGGTAAGAAGSSDAASGASATATATSGSATSSSSAPACATSGLSAANAGGQGAAGSDYIVIDFTNTGGATCTLYGFPGVSLADASGSQVGAAATRDHTHAPVLVTLSPGAKANAVLRVTVAQNYPTGTCGPEAATSLKIYPPNQTGALSMPYKTTGCSKSAVKLLSVSVVTAGAGNANG